MGVTGVPAPVPPCVINHWNQDIKLRILIPLLTPSDTSSPNLQDISLNFFSKNYRFLNFFITLSFDFNLIDILFYFSVLNNFKVGLKVPEEVKWGVKILSLMS